MARERLIGILVGCFAILWAMPAQLLAIDPESNTDKTLAPYFHVPGGEEGVDALPLKSSNADVHIAGVIADVAVAQVYKNNGAKPLEAIYIFPGSTRAAVYAMKMTIGDRTITAKIDTREQARKTYEEARNTGRSASLLEQQRPNVFQMNVANIMPNDEIKVELKYTELLVPTSGIYEFIYPTIVGPRYSNQQAGNPGAEQWVQNPYLHEGTQAPFSTEIKVSLAAGIPIKDVSSSSHKINVAFDGPAAAKISLDSSEKNPGNRDYVLKYRLTGDKIESGLLLYEGQDEKFFLLMAQPPARISSADIPVREYVFIVDVSGSMHGFPLDTSKTLLRDLIGKLRPGDSFNVVLFSGGSRVFGEKSVPANQENINRAVAFIDNEQGGGSTELLPALKRAMELSPAEGKSRSFVLVTDGYVSVEAEAFDYVRSNLNKANFFAFGIGSAVNRHLIEGLAHAGLGEPFVVLKPEEAQATAATFRKYIESPVLTDIKLTLKGFDAYDVEPASIPDLFAERPLLVFGKWRGSASGGISLEGVSGRTAWEQRTEVASSRPSAANSALRYLWARHRIASLADYNSLQASDERVKEITNLGLKYSLLTSHTSFVAVDSEVRNTGDKAATVKQPLPLPQGVSDYAVGGTFANQAMTMAAPAPLRRSKEELSGVAEYELKDAGRAGKSQGTTRVQDEKSALRKLIPELRRCLAKQTAALRFEVTLKQASDGSIAVSVPDSASLSAEEKKCLEKVFRKLTLGAGEKKFTVIISASGELTVE